MTRKSNILSTEPYKGVRDFYPEDQFIQEYIFRHWREVANKFGYEEYSASILEPLDLYKAKSGQEIINEQVYSFIDRGDREVALRPEMTPTVARLVAGKRRELGYPLRLFSMPNLFRYERPQRGRLREHWQLNVDLFGLTSIEADIEILAVAHAIMRSFGATDKDFTLRVSSRKLLNALISDWYELDSHAGLALTKLLDKKAKITPDEFLAESEKIIGKPFGLFDESGKPTQEFEDASKKQSVKDGYEEVSYLIESLKTRGITNIQFDPSIVRGFDYYTGIVFEVYDTNPENNRALFGGGRYDELLNLFGDDSMPACGFGMGDVTIRDFLQVRNLLPVYSNPAQIMICIMNDETNSPLLFANDIADSLRAHNINVAVNYSGKSLADQIKSAEKLHIPFCIFIGANESTKREYSLKNLETGDQVEVTDISVIKNLMYKA